MIGKYATCLAGRWWVSLQSNHRSDLWACRHRSPVWQCRCKARSVIFCDSCLPHPRSRSAYSSEHSCLSHSLSGACTCCSCSLGSEPRTGELRILLDLLWTRKPSKDLCHWEGRKSLDRIWGHRLEMDSKYSAMPQRDHAAECCRYCSSNICPCPSSDTQAWWWKSAETSFSYPRLFLTHLPSPSRLLVPSARLLMHSLRSYSYHSNQSVPWYLMTTSWTSVCLCT